MDFFQNIFSNFLKWFYKKLLNWTNKKLKNLNIYNVLIILHLCQWNEKSRWYDLQFLRYEAWRTEIGNFLYILSFYPPNNTENLNFVKLTKALGDIIILHMKNNDHMMYAFSDTECDNQNYLSFWTIFSPLTWNFLL